MEPSRTSLQQRERPWTTATWLVVLCTVGVTAVVVLPAFVSRPFADEIHYWYLPESFAGDRPWEIIGRVIREIPPYIEVGVFRPLSRLGFYVQYWWQLRFGIAVGIPPHVIAASVKAAMLVAMTTAGLLTVRQYRQAAGLQPTHPAAHLVAGVFPVAAAATLVLGNPGSHPFNLFPALYLGTAAFALFVPCWIGANWAAEQRLAPESDRPGRSGPVVAAVLGLAAASMIELAWLALPLSLAHWLLLCRVSGRQLTKVWRWPSAHLLMALSAGFLVLFVPTRWMIFNACREVACYQAASPAFGQGFVEALPERFLAGALPVQLHQFRYLLSRGGPDPVLWAAGVAVGAVAGYLMVRAARTAGEADGGGGRFLSALAAYAALIALLAAALSASSRVVQAISAERFFVGPWRETGFIWMGWALLLAAGVAAVLGATAPPWHHSAAVALFGLAVAPTLMMNWVAMEDLHSQPESGLYQEVGWLIVRFDITPEGDIRRCDVIDRIHDMNPGDDQPTMLRHALDQTARNHYGQPFCSDA